MTPAGCRGAGQPDPAGRCVAGLAALGPYFAITAHDPGSPVPASWLPLSALLGSPACLRGRITRVRSALAAGRAADAVEFRVAASVTHLGLAARLICPALAAAAVFGHVLRMEPAQVRWQPVLGGPVPLSLPATALAAAGSAPPGTGKAAGDLPDILLTGPVRLLTEMTAAMSVSPAVLWGNVASAVNAAASMIAKARPDLAWQAETVSGALLRAPPLAGTHTTAPPAGFRRRSCCLIYRAAATPGPPFCGDCILNATEPAAGPGANPGRPRRRPRTA